VAAGRTWSVQNPNLYQAAAALKGQPASAERQFWLRFRSPPRKTSAGDDANDFERQAPSFDLVPFMGLWGRNGLWPDSGNGSVRCPPRSNGPELFHSIDNIGKPAVLDLKDREVVAFTKSMLGKIRDGDRMARGNFGPKVHTCLRR